MENKFALKQGELLKLLADRSKLSKVEIAEQLRINPTTLSKIFKYPKLSPKIRAEAARLFKVPIEYFEGVGVQDVTLPIFEEPPPPEYRTGSTWQDIAEQEGKMRAEIARLSVAAVDHIVTGSLDDATQQQLIENSIARVGATS